MMLEASSLQQLWRLTFIDVKFNVTYLECASSTIWTEKSDSVSQRFRKRVVLQKLMEHFLETRENVCLGCILMIKKQSYGPLNAKSLNCNLRQVEFCQRLNSIILLVQHFSHSGKLTNVFWIDRNWMMDSLQTDWKFKLPKHRCTCSRTDSESLCPPDTDCFPAGQLLCASCWDLILSFPTCRFLFDPLKTMMVICICLTWL